MPVADQRVLPGRTAIHRKCGRAALWILSFMVIFSAWAFGTTQEWSIAVMNGCGWLLAAVFVTRRLIAFGSSAGAPWTRASLLLAALTALLLAYTGIAALNAASSYLLQEGRLEPRQHLSWLPHSYDGPASWRWFWTCLALSGVFWAAWDWLAEPRTQTRDHGSSRLSPLLWVLSINAALLGLEAIIQRTSGTNQLLWFMPTRVNRDALAQFGPYAYRSNAAQYLNMVWPVTLGFWWSLHREARAAKGRKRSRHHLLIPCVMIAAAAALYSLSRAGAGVTVLLLVAVAAVFTLQGNASWKMRAGLATLAAATLAVGLFISWNSLGKRFQETADDPLRGRSETYILAAKMADDYPWYGTGPGTFGSLFQIYRDSPEQYWPHELHNDWMEMRITYGRIGFGLMLVALALAMSHWLWGSAVSRDRYLLSTVALAMTGCLLHAIVDFPFQIYSLQFLFVLLAAILFSSSRRRA